MDDPGKGYTWEVFTAPDQANGIRLLSNELEELGGRTFVVGRGEHNGSPAKIYVALDDIVWVARTSSG